jgi:hypothetical protein
VLYGPLAHSGGHLCDVAQPAGRRPPQEKLHAGLGYHPVTGGSLGNEFLVIQPFGHRVRDHSVAVGGEVAMVVERPRFTG